MVSPWLRDQKEGHWHESPTNSPSETPPQPTVSPVEDDVSSPEKHRDGHESYSFDAEIARQLAGAIREKSISEVQALLDSGTNPDMPVLLYGSDYKFPLVCAINDKNVELLEMLLEKGARAIFPFDFRKSYQMPMQHPIDVVLRSGNFAMAKMLLDYGIPIADFRYTISQALGEHDVDMALLFTQYVTYNPLESLQRIHAESTTIIAQTKHLKAQYPGDEVKLIHFMVQHQALHLWPYHESPLQIAIRTENDELAKKLIDSGVRINYVDENGSSALHTSTGAESEEYIKILIEKGAGCQIENTLGETPLSSAVFHGNLPAVQFLLSHLAPSEDLLNRRTKMVAPTPSIPRHHLSPAVYRILPHLASSEDWLHIGTEAVAPLPHIPRQHLSPALHIACQRGFRKIATILLERGADPFHRSDEGNTTLDIALSNRHTNLSIDLLNHGVTFNLANPAVAHFIDDAIESYQLELATSLVRSGAEATPQYQRATQNTLVSQEERDKLLQNVDILDKAMKSLLSKVQIGSGLAARSALCSACLQFLRRPPRFYETCLEQENIYQTGCDLCGLARDSLGIDMANDSTWSVQFLARNDKNETRFKIRLSTKTGRYVEHEIRQLSGIGFHA